MTAKHRITINLDDAEYAALQRIAAGTDRSLSWLGRRAICDFIEHREREDIPLFGALRVVKPTSRGSAT